MDFWTPITFFLSFFFLTPILSTRLPPLTNSSIFQILRLLHTFPHSTLWLDHLSGKWSITYKPCGVFSLCTLKIYLSAFPFSESFISCCFANRVCESGVSSTSVFSKLGRIFCHDAASVPHLLHQSFGSNEILRGKTQMLW